MSLSLLSNTKSYKQSTQSLDNEIEFIGKCLAFVTSVMQKQNYLYTCVKKNKGTQKCNSEFSYFLSMQT